MEDFDPDDEPGGWSRRSWWRILAGAALFVGGAAQAALWAYNPDSLIFQDSYRYRAYHPFDSLLAAGLGLSLLIFEWMWKPAPDDADPPPKP